VIDLAYDEARLLNNNYIGTEHILLGLIREDGGLAHHVLIKLGAGLERTRQEALGLQEKEKPKENNEFDGTTPLEDMMKRLRRVAKELGRIDPGQMKETLKAAMEESAESDVAQVGDLGVARATKPEQSKVEVALDAGVFVNLVAVYTARDAHGYRAMANGDQTMFLVPDGTPLKLLVAPPDSEAATKAGGSYVRVLSGPYKAYAGWIFSKAFERTGPDEADFPPAIEG
jgi:hypothetical protein